MSSAPEMNHVYRIIKLGGAGDVADNSHSQLPHISRNQIKKRSIKKITSMFIQKNQKGNKIIIIIIIMNNSCMAQLSCVNKTPCAVHSPILSQTHNLVLYSNIFHSTFLCILPPPPNAVIPTPHTLPTQINCRSCDD